jgi:hypothetical protein
MTDPNQRPAGPPLSEAEDQQYATLATFLNIIPLIPALIFYFAFGTRGPKIAEQSKENLNWTINITAILIICWILTALPVLNILAVLWGLIYAAAEIVNIVFSIIGGIAVSNGQLYRYPMNIRWIK